MTRAVFVGLLAVVALAPLGLTSATNCRLGAAFGAAPSSRPLDEGRRCAGRELSASPGRTGSIFGGAARPPLARATTGGAWAASTAAG